MVMPASRTDWTVDMLHDLPVDSNRYELIDGVLFVSPSPSPVHQRAVGTLYVILHAYVAGLDLEVFFAPAAITWSSRTEVQPDLLAIPLVNGRHVERFEDVQSVVLAVEVLSPSTTRTDRFTKRREYQRRGVAEFWIVDTAARSVERWRPNDEEPEISFDSFVWQPRAHAAPLAIDLVAFFRDVHGE
jgi:Uma2 family endonuclease